MCQRNELVGNEKWFALMPGATPPLGLRRVEVEGTPDSPLNVHILGTRGVCTGIPRAPDTVSLARIVFAMAKTDGLPDFLERTKELRISPPPPPSSQWDVEYDVAMMQKSIPGAHLALLQARAEKDGWIFTTELMPRWGVRWVATPYFLEIEADGGSAREHYSFRVDHRRSEEYLRFETRITEKTTRFADPHFRLVSIRPDLSPSKPRK
jgi:hypothetical protein